MSSGGIGLNNKPAPTLSQQVGGVNPDGDLIPLQVNGSGALITTGSGGGGNDSVGLIGDPVPLYGTFMGAEDGSGNLVGLLVDGSGNLKVSGSFTPPVIQDVNLTEVAGAAIALGQTTMSASLPVAIASNQTAIPASQSGTWSVRVQDGSGNAINSSSNALNINAARFGGSAVTLGQSNSLGSMPVVLASDQSTVDVNVTNSPLSVSPATTFPISGSVSQAGTWSVRLQDGSGNAITSTSNALNVNISSPASVGVKGPATSFVRTVVTTTGTTPVQIAAVSNQIGIEVEPLGAGNVYWGPSNTISSTNSGRINQYNPLRRETSADVYICVASGASNVDCAVYQWVRA